MVGTSIKRATGTVDARRSQRWLRSTGWQRLAAAHPDDSKVPRLGSGGGGGGGLGEVYLWMRVYFCSGLSSGLRIAFQAERQGPRGAFKPKAAGIDDYQAVGLGCKMAKVARRCAS